jgi:hypothetical protein
MPWGPSRDGFQPAAGMIARPPVKCRNSKVTLDENRILNRVLVLR